MIRKPEQWIEIARLTFDDAVPGEVLPSHGPLNDQDRVLFRDWECAAAPRGVHKFLVSGLAIQMHEEQPVLSFGQVCHRTADRELLLKDRRLRDGQISALVLPQDAECGPTSDRADCAEALVGIVFRLSTVRQYYQFGIEGMRRLVLYRRNHDEWTVLAEHPLPAVNGWIDLTVNLRGDAIHCVSRAAGVDLTVTDTLFHSGRVGVRALRRALLKSLTVTQTASAADRERASDRRTSETLHQTGERLPDAVPIASFPFNAAGGRTPKFGDFAVQGRHDLLLPHENHLSAVSADGSILWEFPEPATDLVLSTDYLSEHGRLIVAMGGQVVEEKIEINGRPVWTRAKATELLVIAGRTGKLLARAPLPVSPSAQSHYIELMKYTARLSGTEATDIVVRDNRSDLPSSGGTTVWAYDRFLRPLWQVTQERDMAHYGHDYALAPFDVDGDGRDEILAGGILYGADGCVRWRHDRGRDVANWPNGGDHYDNVVIGNFSGDPTFDPVVGLAASSAGFFLVDGLSGETIAWHRIGHAQFIIAAKVRQDMEGAQIVVANHHGSNGVLSLFSGRGEYLWSIQPSFHVMEPPVALAWPGAEADLLWMHTLDSGQALYDGFGRCVKRFPKIEAVIGEYPHRYLNAQAVRFGSRPQPVLAFTANDRLHVFGPAE